MACIGEASRFRLVQALLGGARCVTDLAADVGLSQSCTTRHLQALERRQVVCGAREGKRVMYRLCHEEPALGSLLAWAMSPDGARAVGPVAPAERTQRREREPGRRGARHTSSPTRAQASPGRPARTPRAGAEASTVDEAGAIGATTASRPAAAPPRLPGAAPIESQAAPSPSPTAGDPASADVPPTRPRRAELEDYLL